MIPFAVTPKLIAYGVAAVAIVGGIFWVRAHWIGVGEDRVRNEYSAALGAQIAADRKQRAADTAAAAGVSDTLSALSKLYADLASRPPVVLTQTRVIPATVTANAPPTCRDSSLSADFRLRFNEAAANP